jgi:hypothetical protein
MNLKFRLLLSIALIAPALAANHSEGETERWSEDDLFFYGLLAGGFVSLIGFIAAFLLLSLRKVLSESIFTIIIQILFAFSCGALLAETMLHILPEAYSSRHLKDENISLTFIAAIMVFILLERILEKVGIAHTHWHDEEEHEESHHVA